MGWLSGWEHRKTVSITGQTGAGCPTDDALLLTPEGLKHPSELKEGDYIISHEGLKKVLHNNPDYEDEVFEIEVVGGHKLRFSKNHRFPTNRGILRAFELKENDILFEPFTNERVLRETTKRYKKEILEKYFTERKRKTPSEAYKRSFYELKNCNIEETLNGNITERDLYLAEMLGISDAEGKPRKYKTQRSIGYSLNLSINGEEVEFLNRIKYLSKKLWGVQPRINKYNQNSKGITVSCKTEAGKELLPYQNISLKEKFLFKNIKLLAAYCKGFWRGDGCELNGYKEAGQSEVNDDLRRFKIYLQLLGRRSGRFSSLNKKTGNREWKVKWYNEPRMQFTRRITKVKRIKERTRIWRLAVEDEHYIFNGLLSLNSNYQVDFSIGDASGGDFHLENHCTSFPNDIRVTDNDQTTLLDYWVEDLTVDPITMWVEVADDLGSNVDICVYYGKSGASSASNIDTTFLFGDDFPGDTLDTNKWNYGGTPTVGSGYVQFDPGEEISSKSTFPINRSMVSHAKINTIGSYGQFWVQISATDGSLTWIRGYGQQTYFQLMNHDGAESSVNTDTSRDLSYHKFDIRRLSTKSQAVIDDGGTTDNVNNYGTADGSVRFWTRGGGGIYDTTGQVDWVFVRKFITPPEPAFSNAGAEENSFVPYPLLSGMDGGIGEAMTGGIAR